MGQLSFIWRYVVVMFVSLVFWEAKGTVQISTDVNNVFLSWIIYSLNMNGSNIYQQQNTLQFFFLLLVVFFPISFLFIWKNHARFNLNWRSLAHNTISAHTSPNQNMAWMFLVPISTTIHGSTEKKPNPKPKTHRFFYSISFSSTLFFVVLFVGFYYIFSLSLVSCLFFSHLVVWISLWILFCFIRPYLCAYVWCLFLCTDLSMTLFMQFPSII